MRLPVLGQLELCIEPLHGLMVKVRNRTEVREQEWARDVILAIVHNVGEQEWIPGSPPVVVAEPANTDRQHENSNHRKLEDFYWSAASEPPQQNHHTWMLTTPPS